MILNKSLRKVSRVGRQPLLLVVTGVVLVGFAAAILSWNAPNKPLPRIGSGYPQSGTALGLTSSNDLNQNSQGEAINPQNSNTTAPAKTTSTPPPVVSSPPVSPTPEPPVIIAPPIEPPCNFCAPVAGRACPMFEVYPCYHCGGPPYVDILCQAE